MQKENNNNKKTWYPDTNNKNIQPWYKNVIWKYVMLIIKIEKQKSAEGTEQPYQKFI